MIYFAEAVGLGHVKIGFTDRDDVLERINSLQTGCPVPIRLLGTIPGTLEDEKNLHRRFAAAQVQGEWFQPTAELLAIVPVSGRPACGPAEVVLRSVQVRVLTVNKRQMTQAFLRQVPDRDIMDWARLVDCRVPLDDLDPHLLERGTPWGMVNYQDTYADPNGYAQKCWQWIIWEEAGTLYKCPAVLPNPRDIFLGTPYADCKRPFGFFQKCQERWRSFDRLFIGV